MDDFGGPLFQENHHVSNFLGRGGTPGTFGGRFPRRVQDIRHFIIHVACVAFQPIHKTFFWVYNKPWDDAQ